MTPSDANSTADAPAHDASRVLALLVDAERARARVFGLTAAERLARGLARAGVARVSHDEPGATASPSEERVLLVRADTFYDERLLGALATAAPGTLLLDDAGERRLAIVARASELARAREVLAGSDASGVGALAPRRPGDLVSGYDEKLRKHQPPFALPALDQNVRGVENEIFAASYKGITDLVTKWVWPIPARAAVRACVRRGITPNAVTAVSYALALAVIGLWSIGGYGFAIGLALAWIMTFLDTVDGKLARCTLTSSRFGHVLDHGLDLAHPPLWWAAWAYGLADGAPGVGSHAVTMWIVVGGYVVGRLLEGVFLLLFGMEMFTWRPFDGWFRQVIARRNPNLLLLTAALAFGSPEAGLFALAVWTVGSIAIQLARIGQALAQRSSGRPIRPWVEERARAAGGLLLALALATAPPFAPARANGDSSEPAASTQPDPSVRLGPGDASDEYQLLATLDDGSQLLARILITNAGPGERNAIASGLWVEREGRVHAFDNVRRSDEWQLAASRKRLDIGTTHLELDRDYARYRIDKKRIRVDLQLPLRARAALAPDFAPAGTQVELLATLAPIIGSIELDEWPAPRTLTGTASLVHSWSRDAAFGGARYVAASGFDRSAREAALLLHWMRPGAPGRSWMAMLRADDALDAYENVSVSADGSLSTAEVATYPVPAVLRVLGDDLEGSVTSSSVLFEQNFLKAFPQPLRTVMGMALDIRPHRVWARSVIDVTLRASSGGGPHRFQGEGSTATSFSDTYSGR